MHCRGRPVWCLLVRREQSAEGPSSAWRACCVQEGPASWPPPLGSHTDPVEGRLTPSLQGGWAGVPSHHEKGDPGRHRLAVRWYDAPGGIWETAGQRQKRPEVTADSIPSPGAAPVCSQAWGVGGTRRGVRVWGPVSGHPCPMCLAPLTPTSASSLWGPRGLGNPHLGLVLTLPPSHARPTTGPPKPALMGIRPLPQPHDHPNLSLWASDLQRTPHDFRQSCQHPPLPGPPRPSDRDTHHGDPGQEHVLWSFLQGFHLPGLPPHPRGTPQTGQATG